MPGVGWNHKVVLIYISVEVKIFGHFKKYLLIIFCIYCFENYVLNFLGRLLVALFGVFEFGLELRDLYLTDL